MIKPVDHATWSIHAYVECRVRAGAWWLFARPAVSSEPRIAALLTDRLVDPDDEPLVGAEIPADLSPDVLDEYTWRVAGRYGADAGNVVSVAEAASWLQRGVSRRFTTREPFARVVDPRWEHATVLSRDEVGALIATYERAGDLPAPATWCAVDAMMKALERDYRTRLVVWLERVHEWAEPGASVPMHRDHAAELDRVRRSTRGQRAVR